jgi:ATP phosphoribosyltransferase
LLIEAGRSAAAGLRLTAAGVGPVTASRPDFVFEVASPGYQALAEKIGSSVKK